STAARAKGKSAVHRLGADGVADSEGGIRCLTSKVSGGPVAGEAPPAGVRVDRWLRRQHANADYMAVRSDRRGSVGHAVLQGWTLSMKHAKATVSLQVRYRVERNTRTPQGCRALPRS